MSTSEALALPVFIALPDAAARLSLCERTVRRAISSGELLGYKFGKAVRVKTTELDAWADSHMIPAADMSAL